MKFLSLTAGLIFTAILSVHLVLTVIAFNSDCIHESVLSLKQIKAVYDLKCLKDRYVRNENKIRTLEEELEFVTARQVSDQNDNIFPTHMQQAMANATLVEPPIGQCYETRDEKSGEQTPVVAANRQGVWKFSEVRGLLNAYKVPDTTTGKYFEAAKKLQQEECPGRLGAFCDAPKGYDFTVIGEVLINVAKDQKVVLSSTYAARVNVFQRGKYGFSTEVDNTCISG